MAALDERPLPSDEQQPCDALGHGESGGASLSQVYDGAARKGAVGADGKTSCALERAPCEEITSSELAWVTF